jgi:hypothetical protein
MAAREDVAAYIARANARVTQGFLGGDPRVGSDEREAFRLHRGDSTSYIHASDVPNEVKVAFYNTRNLTRPNWAGGE